MIKLLLFGSLGATEIILLVILFILLFGGARKIPELMKGMGKGIRMFRESMDGIDEEVKADIDPKSEPQRERKGTKKPAARKKSEPKTEE